MRRVLNEAGETAYTPMMFAGNIFAAYHPPLKSAWAGYLTGERTLTDASLDLVQAVDGADQR